MDGSANTAKDYLRRPYARVLTPDEEYGGYTAEILEFSGCITEGDTASAALENLDEAAEAWIEAALDMGHEIPEPSDSQEYSGRIALLKAENERLREHYHVHEHSDGDWCMHCGGTEKRDGIL